eukprot:m.354599 g.354599  ORF g.354599 m.354599 type:complete len:99 (-) comp17063_c0_seq1:743-1039(-)
MYTYISFSTCLPCFVFSPFVGYLILVGFQTRSPVSYLSVYVTCTCIDKVKRNACMHMCVVEQEHRSDVFNDKMLSNGVYSTQEKLTETQCARKQKETT